MSRLLRPVAGASNPEFLRPTLRVVTLRPHVMNLVVETDSLVDGQRQRRRARKKKLSTALITCFCPHLESCALPEKKSCKRRNNPVSFITVNCADVCVVRSTLGFSVTASASCELEVESFVASSFSAPKLSLEGSKTQHLHRLQVASVASGLSQSIPLVSFMLVSVDPSFSSTIFGLLYKHISLSHARGKTKHVLHVAVVKHGACESDTEPHLHLRLACRATCYRYEHHIVVALLFQRTQRDSRLSRNPRPELHQDISSLVTRRATSCGFSPKILTVCLLGIVLGESSVFQHRVWKSAPWDALKTSIFKHLVNRSLRTTSSHTFNKPEETDGSTRTPTSW